MKHTIICLLAFLTLAIFGQPTIAAPDERPNVIVIMSDDQGGGDYGFLGNDLIRTPQLDAMHRRSGLLSNFYVSPVCAPTRASLMTGRYNYRTRCIDTFQGRAMMDSAEVTIAEVLQGAGYRTGIFGKWHLGDNYPLRPMDQGFEESLVHRGGGIGQNSDPIGGEGKYTNPTLVKNGVEVPMEGYCTDIYFDQAMKFMETSVAQKKSFFSYIATNAPHGPFNDVPEELLQEYLKVDFSPIEIGKAGARKRKGQADKLARIAAMITNIDQNVGRLFERLDKLGIRENTIVIYLNDNGPNSARYVGNMRGTKTAVDDGGIRSPLIFHWPAKVSAEKTSDKLCAHIDVFPTLLDACGVEPPEDVKIDGRSFFPLLTEDDAAWPTRQVVLQTHRGNVPHKFHHFALHEDQWKLVHASGFGKEQFSGEPKLQLFDLSSDPRQRNDLASAQPEVLDRLKSGYESWFEDVSSTRPDNYAPPRIVIGTEFEKQTILTRQDWRDVSSKPNGHWLLESNEPGNYKVEIVLYKETTANSRITLTAGSNVVEVDVDAEKKRGHFAQLKIPAGKFRLSVDVDINGKVQGPRQVILTRTDGE